MGLKSNSGHFKNTNGTKYKFPFKLDLQLFAEMPKNISQIKHIMREAEGHFPDSEINRKVLVDLSNDPKNYLGKDKFGNEWYAKLLQNGKQIWCIARNNIIQNGGINEKPIEYKNNIGLKKRKINWRKKDDK